MHYSVKNLNLIKNKANKVISKTQQKTNAEFIAISKTFTEDKILPLLESGHLHFGENKIQEAEEKWISLKKKYNNIKLHLVGKLQSNKAKKAVMLFDYIHSLDSIKLATKIDQYEKELNKKTKIFIQVNVAGEVQKSGILLKDLDSFYDFCKKNLSLNIIGLMVLPPLNEDPNKYFKILRDKSRELNLKDLSMGMSSDYEKALLFDSTFLRLGTAIFGKRNN